MKNKSLLIIEKMPYYNYKKLFSFKKSTIILKSNDLESSFDEEWIKTKYQDIFLKTQF